MDQEKDPQEVPKEILTNMTMEEQQAIKEAFNIHIEHKIGNMINMTCKTGQMR